MDEEMFTREPSKKSSGFSEIPEREMHGGSHSEKLMNETSAGESYRKKLRHGKKDNRLSKEEARKLKKQKRQGRKKIYKEAAIAAKARQTVICNEDNNAGTDSMNAGITATEVAVNRLRTETEKTREAIRAHDKARSAESKSKSAKYSEKFHKRTKAQEVSALEEKTGSLAKQAQKNLMKKEIQEHAFRQQAAEAANGFGNVAKKFTDKAEDLMGRIAEAVVEFFEEHPGILLIVAIVLLVVLVISASLTSCSAAVGGVNDISVVTSYTAQDEEIVQADEDYITKEEELQEKISKIETDYPGYDEYRYTLDEIGHNPYELAALLTVLYEDYTAAEVQTMLQTIFDKQYKLTLTPVTETRTRTVTKTDPETGDEYEEEEEYEWKVLKVKLDNKSIDGIISEMGISDDQYARYQILLETFGNKRYLFADSEYALPRYSPIADYEVPAEYLTDVQFGNMLHEAEKYLNYPYVWGGSSPSTSFDCSGFVSWVINHCGNGWNVGRLGANGLYNRTQRIAPSEAKPGDLIFFQHTYSGAGNGASHVGIYVGNGMMLHCGNPIKYTSINTSYWQSHFLGYGRIVE